MKTDFTSRFQKEVSMQKLKKKTIKILKKPQSCYKRSKWIGRQSRKTKIINNDVEIIKK